MTINLKNIALQYEGLENTIRCRACKVRNLRKSVNSLTNNVAIQLNKINRLLKEIDQEK